MSFRRHFAFVLALILTTLAFGLAAPDEDWARAIGVTLQGATLVAAVIASQAHIWVIRMTTTVVAVMVVAALAALIGSDQFGTDAARVISLLLVALAPAAIVTALVRDVRAEGGVTVHTMFGVLCLYLLIGLLFATVFATFQVVFHVPVVTHATHVPDDFLYFSFATLTTVGYGDIVAAGNVGRSIAITEALTGQIYLVTVVALIVSNVQRPARRPSRS